MDILLKVLAFSLLVGATSALLCAQCTYKAGIAPLPMVMGVTWIPRGSPSHNPACKAGGGELNVFECANVDHRACYTRFYTYNTTTYYERGCTSFCHTLPEVTLAPGLQMTQLCCDEGNRCNHPENDRALLMAARNDGQERPQMPPKEEIKYKPETPEGYDKMIRD